MSFSLNWFSSLNQESENFIGFTVSCHKSLIKLTYAEESVIF